MPATADQRVLIAAESLGEEMYHETRPLYYWFSRISACIDFFFNFLTLLPAASQCLVQLNKC
jgi:hypothetical protein